MNKVIREEGITLLVLPGQETLVSNKLLEKQDFIDLLPVKTTLKSGRSLLPYLTLMLSLMAAHLSYLLSLEHAEETRLSSFQYIVLTLHRINTAEGA